jgi:hypothetical protein
MATQPSRAYARLSVHRSAAARLAATSGAKSGPCITTHVNAEALGAALRLARGDPARLVILDDHTVAVANRPRGGGQS